VDPLIITATPNICWLHPNTPYPTTPEAMAAEGRRCQDAGAAILHVHAEDWIGTIDAVRRETDLIVQCGMSSHEIPQRMVVFEHGADMISIITSHHDEAFVGLDMHKLHSREELAEYARLSREYGVRLEYETWHTGGIWNLQWLIERDLVEPPYFTSIFFGWPGGSWSPPTIDEYLRRSAAMPEGSVSTVSVMAPEQIRIAAAAIVEGDHVRVGTEDYPYDRAGNVAETHQLVAELAEVARAVGREIATPAQAREIVGARSIAR
jgi:3-keto-5-aminohexanoate cleavage enzyme